MYHGSEQALPSALGALAIARILFDVRNQPRIENALPIACGIKAAIQIERGPYSQNIQTRVPTRGYASPIARTSACLPHPSHPYSSPIWTVQVAGERRWTG